MTTPKITICMSCYNAAEHIGSAIDSAVAQDWDNKELLIVDDCSTDNSVAVVTGKIKDIPYARLVRHEQNMGVAGSVNTLISSATGDFLAFFDDDDFSVPERLRTQYDAITVYESRTRAAHVICYAGIQKIYPNGYIASKPAIGSQPVIPVGEDMVNFHLYLPRKSGLFYGSGTPNCALMARASTLRAVGPYDVTLRRNEDADFAVRIGLLGGHFIGTTETLVHQSATGGADKHPEVAYKSDRAFLMKYADILNKYGRFDFALAWCEIKYLHYAGKDGKALGIFLLAFLKHPWLHTAHLLRAAPARILHEWKMK